MSYASISAQYGLLTHPPVKRMIALLPNTMSYLGICAQHGWLVGYKFLIDAAPSFPPMLPLGRGSKGRRGFSKAARRSPKHAGNLSIQGSGEME